MSEPRRSVRSTKGVNNRLSEINAEPVTPVPKRRGGNKKSTTPHSVEPEEPAEKEGGADDIIRCVCGAKEEDEDDERMMIQCEGCDAWQHTQCMGIPKKKIPDQYFCEICKPEKHSYLLEQMARGERPWEKKPGGKRRKSAVAKPATPATEKKERASSLPKVESTPAPARQRKQPQPQTPAERAPPVTPINVPAPPPPPEAPAPAPPAPLPVSEPVSVTKEEPVHEIGTAVAEDKMDIDPPVAVQHHSDAMVPEHNEIAMVDREATIPAEDISPDPPAPAAEAPSAPKQDPQTPVPRPKQKKERSDSSSKQSKRKATHDDSDTEYHHEEDKEPEKKVRRMSTAAPSNDSLPKTPQHAERRRSSASGVKSAAPKKQVKADDTTPQMELVDSIGKLRNTSRQKVAEYMISQIIDRAKLLVDNGTLGLRDDVTPERLCEDLVLQVEHYVYINHFKDGQISPEYTKKARSIGFNLKQNAALMDEFLGGRLMPERLASMSTEEMASKKLKEFTQQARMESEKQHTLIKEEGPRIRRTHKGEELIDEIKENAAHNGQDTLLGSGQVHRRPTEPLEDPLPPLPTAKSPSAAAESPTTVTASETPRSPSLPGSKPPPPIDTQASEKKGRSFSLENVWSHVESPDTDRVRPARPLTQTPISAKPPDNKIDKDIDMLLKDDDHEGTPPYSPASFDDHYSPPPTTFDDGAWHGRIEMNSIANFSATATLLGGPEQLGDKKWTELLDPALNIYGRIQVDRATEYLCGQRYSKSSTLVMTSLTPSDSRSQGDFDKFYDYFKKKDRYAVVNKHSQQCIKDLYVVPIDATDDLPDWFNVVDPPSKVPANNRSTKMLVLIFVVIRNLVPGAQVHGTPTPTPTTAAGMAGSVGVAPNPMIQPPQPSFSPHQPQQPYAPPAAQPPQLVNSPLQQQPYPQHYPQYPQTQAPIQPQPSSQSPQPMPPHPTHPSHLPPAQQQQQPIWDGPKHEMTKELIKMLPRMANEQVMAIDNLLSEKPQLQTDPQALSKEIEKVLGPPQPPPPGHMLQHPPPQQLPPQ